MLVAEDRHSYKQPRSCLKYKNQQTGNTTSSMVHTVIIEFDEFDDNEMNLIFLQDSTHITSNTM